MAIRVRKDGTMWCAAHTDPRPGDTYIDDGLHYEMSVVKGVIVALPMPAHLEHCQWWWTSQASDNADFRMASRASPAPQLAERGGVAVKALEWAEDRDDDGTEIHRTRGGEVNLTYTIYEDGFIKKPFSVSLNQLRIGSFYTVAEAKAAAQADYERRILSALAPSERPDLVAQLDALIIKHRAEVVAWFDARFPEAKHIPHPDRPSERGEKAFAELETFSRVHGVLIDSDRARLTDATAREIIAELAWPLDRECVDNIIEALTAAGIRLLGPDELDPVTIERCAAEMQQIAQYLRADADKIVAEWTGPDIDADDRAANYRYAREQRAKAPIYESAAAAIRALAEREG